LCPDDIALVGFSETELAQLVDPPLTSVEQPTFEMGETAARLLLAQITELNPPEPETISLIAKLHVRKSSINVKKD
jgi:LacI family transcriptional regulator